MNVQSISFLGVYRSTDKKFSPTQYAVSEKIIKRLTSEDYVNSRGYTPAENLKKQGFDIIISPTENDSVYIEAVTGLKRENDIKAHTYSESIYVGQYDSNYDFELKDINKAINNRSIGAAAFLIPVIAFASLIVGSAIKGYNRNKSAKPVIENIITKDSIKAVSKDTISFTNNVR